MYNLVMKYQEEYASKRKQMYDLKSRKKKAERMIKIFENYFGKENLQNLSLLDIGCSTGIISNELAESFKKVIGMDIDQGAIRFAKKKYKRKNLSFRVGDAMKIPFDNENFDVVTCSHVYEHVPDDKKLMNEIYRVLKPRGICFFAAIDARWPIEPHYNLPFLSLILISLHLLKVPIAKLPDQRQDQCYTSI